MGTIFLQQEKPHRAGARQRNLPCNAPLA
jgi:hypothetical protein